MNYLSLYQTPFINKLVGNIRVNVTVVRLVRNGPGLRPICSNRFVPFSAVGGPVDLYNNQNFCIHLGPTVNEDKDQCINPEGFSSFIGLLESIPLHDTGSNNGSSDYSMPDLR